MVSTAAAVVTIVACGERVISICKGIRGFWCSSSTETIEAERQARAKIVALEKATATAEAQHQLDLKKVTDVLQENKARLDAVAQAFQEAKEKEERGLVNMVPACVRQQVVRVCNASLDTIKKGGRVIGEFTCKQHPYVTITLVLLPTGYVLYRKYGKRVKDACTRLVTSEDRAMEKMHAIQVKVDNV
jgi:hypothetical protein